MSLNLSLPKSWTSRLRRPQAGWIGVDVGTSAIKLAQVERSKGTWRIAGSALIPLPGATQDSGLPADDSAWQDLLRPVRRSRVFRGTAAAAVLPMAMLDLRSLDLPDGSPAELRQMIAQELEASGPEGDREFAFWKTSQPGSSQTPAQFSVLAVPRTVATRAAERLLEAGLRCEVLDVLPFALARAIQLAAPGASARPRAALDWGAASAVFTLAVDGRPAFTRCFRECGVMPLQDAVCHGLGLSAGEARQVLASCGVPVPHLYPGSEPRPQRSSPDPSTSRIQTAIGEFAAPVIRRIVVELRKTLAWIEQQSGRPPAEIWLCGGGAIVRNMAECLSAEVGLPVRRWRLPDAPSGDRPDDAAESLFATAAALSALHWEDGP